MLTSDSLCHVLDALVDGALQSVRQNHRFAVVSNLAAALVLLLAVPLDGFPHVSGETTIVN